MNKNALTPRTHLPCVQGRGDRIFLLTHVMVHVLSIILTVIFLSNVADHAQTNSVTGDYFAAVRA